MTQVVVITTCTGRKRIQAADAAHFRHVPPLDVDAAARYWLNRLSGIESVAPAASLYSGRGFAEARRAAKLLNAPLKVISAGHGLIDADIEIASYEATISPGSPDGILSRLNVCPARWWGSLKKCQQFRWPDGEALLLVAASGPYLQMVEEDLLELPVERLRLFTRSDVEMLRPSLRRAVMPYDARLDAKGGLPGTIADFAQRALAHFAERILLCSPEGSLEEHRAGVQSQLALLIAPTKRIGQRSTDEEIKALIRAHFSDVEGQSSRMLEKLRNELGVACEQSRFRSLFWEVARGKEMEAACLPL